MAQCNICRVDRDGSRLYVAYRNGEKVKICNNCKRSMAHYCADCNKSIVVENNSHNFPFGFTCNKCLVNSSFDTDGILDYSFKPIPIFRGGVGSSDVLTMGMELEMADGNSSEEVDDFAIKILKYEKLGYSFFYGKYDGSLDEPSVEVVCHPATLEFHKTTEYWKRMLNEAKNAGLKSNDTDCCGIHIHVNRNYFNNEQVNKLDALVNRISRTFRRFARRNCRDYARYSPDKSLSHLGTNSFGRYSCLNINQNTIEFRIFKGNMKYESIMALFELVQGSCDFVKQDSINMDLFFGDRYILKKTFKEYLESRNFTYLPDYTEMCRVWRDLEPTPEAQPEVVEN